MKLVLWILLIVAQQGSGQVTRLACNSSGITIIKPICKLQLVSRTNRLMSIGGETIREMKEPLILYTWYYKYHATWHQIFKSPWVSFCDLIGSDKKFPFYAEWIEEMRKNFPAIPMYCPIKPGKYYAYNTSISDSSFNLSFTSASDPNTVIANGQHRHSIRLSTKDDPNMYNINWIYQMYKKFGVDRF